MTDTQLRAAAVAHLDDADDVKFTDDPVWYSVRALRAEAAGVPLSQDQEFTPPDPYQRDLTAMRAASATPASATETSFEVTWKATRREAFAAESRRRDEHFASHPTSRSLTAAERAEIPAAPDPYKADLDKMRSEGR